MRSIGDWVREAYDVVEPMRIDETVRAYDPITGELVGQWPSGRSLPMNLQEEFISLL